MYTENHTQQIWAMVQIQTEKLKNPVMTETQDTKGCFNAWLY